MITLTANSLNALFTAACSTVLEQGENVAPRGKDTREVIGVHLRLTDPRRRLLDIPPVRVLNPAFAVAETIWVLSGSDATWIYDFNDALRQFSDGGVLQGAYGPRMRSWGSTAASLRDSEAAAHGAVASPVDQLDAVRRLLRHDPDSRRAVIQLFDPSRDFRGHLDVPCTLGYRFYLRKGRLHMHTTMRSQDLWWGFGYDVFAATVLQELLAGWLGADVGEYNHHVDSLHIYAPFLDQAAALPTSPPPGQLVAIPAIPWGDLDQVLRDTLRPRPSLRDEGKRKATDGWDEAALVLNSYRLWKSGDRSGARTCAARASGTMASALERWYGHLDAKRAHADVVRQPNVSGVSR